MSDTPSFLASKRPLAKRLLVFILLVSSCVTLFATALQLYVDYRRDRSAARQSVEQIETSRLETIEDVLWSADAVTAQVLLDDMLGVPFIEEVSLETAEGEVLSAGSRTSARAEEHTWTIARLHRNQEIVLGELRVVCGLDLVYERLRSRVSLILVAQAAKTFLVSIFILFFVYILVTRPLQLFLKEIVTTSVDTARGPIEIPRPGRGKTPDEIDKLIDTYNERSAILAERYGTLANEHELLTSEVESRGNQITGVVESLRDEITQRMETEEAVVTKSAQLNAVIEQFPGVLWTVDPTLHFTSILGSETSPLDLAPEVWIGRSLTEHPSLGKAATGLVAAHRTALSGHRTRLELDLDGHAFEVIVEAIDSSEPIGCLSVLMDVTARQVLEQEREEGRLREAQRMESLGLLAGGIAHDFNNLLTGVLGNALLLKEEVEGNDHLVSTVDNIAAAAQRAAELTRQMLAYSGKGQYVVEAVDIAKLTKEMITLVTASASKKVLFDLVAEGGPLVAKADATQLRQVILNLLTNGADAIGDEAGTVSVHLSRRQLRPGELEDLLLNVADERKEYLVIEVNDTGRGMSDETRLRMFDPYFSTKRTGHGLGLAAVLGIVRSHSGSIRVQSRPSDGTTVTVFIPASLLTASSEISLLELADLAPTTGQTVLVIDDEPTVLTVARSILERSGFTVLTAKDGSEGIAVYTEQQAEIRAVVLDIVLPDMNGQEVLKELRALRPALPVLLVSGFADLGMRRSRMGEHTDFLQKPYSPRGFIDALNAIIPDG